jgi:bifunctional non-homologous end joining protein LigD
MAPLPLIVPMQPTSVTRPFHHDGWIYEEKVDGWRVIAYKDGDQVELIGGRSGRDHTKRFPGLAAAIAGLPDRRLILDGEVAIFDKDLIESTSQKGRMPISLPSWRRDYSVGLPC